MVLRLLSEQPCEDRLVELSVVEVYNNQVLDLLSPCPPEGGAPDQRRHVITTATGASEVPSLTYQWVDQSPVLWSHYITYQWSPVLWSHYITYQ